MNDKVKSHADMVAIEFRLLRAWDKANYDGYYEFTAWLEYQLEEDNWYWKKEVTELITWYESRVK